MTILAPLFDVLARTGLDALVVVPGANFRRVFAKDFHQMERPLAIIVPRVGEAVAVVPNLEMGSFTPIGFPGRIFDWRDENGYMGAFLSAGEALPQLRQGTRIGVEGQRMRVFDLMALQKALPGAEFTDIHAEISSIRLHKTARELELQRKAIRISEAALEATLAEIKAGMAKLADPRKTSAEDRKKLLRRFLRLRRQWLERTQAEPAVATTEEPKFVSLEAAPVTLRLITTPKQVASTMIG